MSSNTPLHCSKYMYLSIHDVTECNDAAELGSQLARVLRNENDSQRRNNVSAETSLKGQKLRDLYKDGTSSAEVRIRIASAMAAMIRLKRILRCNTISFAIKFKLN